MAATRVARLPRGLTLVVRRATMDDVDALAALYDELTLDDLYRRFFCGSPPPRTMIERWVAMEGDAGALLVAEVQSGDSRPGTVVAEASWFALPDGGGEFGLTVADSWRGWLGPYLLDTLVEAAAAQGVPNLQADVLADNRRMLAVVKARGYVVLGQPDWSIVRIMIATVGGVPAWPPLDPRPRVLVEVPGARWRAATEAANAGLRVIGCYGPSGTPKDWCPALRGERCPLAEGADVVVNSLRADDERTAAVLAAHCARKIPVLTDLPLQAGAAADAVVAQVRSGVHTE